VSAKQETRYWGDRTPPENKVEFFNAITVPSPSNEGAMVATIRMYGPIDSWGGWWGISAADVLAVVDALPDSVEQIILRINSPGGEIFEATSILNSFRAHKATVTAVVDGLAASAASFIAAGCDETVMSPGSQMMIHSPLTFTYGQAKDLRKTADILDNLERSIIDIYQEKAGEKDWKSLLDAETWMTPAEAVALGLADRVGVVQDAGPTESVGGEDELVVIQVEPEADDRVSARVTRMTGAAAAALVHKLPSSSEPGEPNQKEKLNMSDTIKAGLRERLGVTDADATDESLLTALDQRLTANPAPTAIVAPPIPAGAIVMDAAAVEELRANAAAGVAAREQQINDRRDAVVAKALNEGRITAESKDSWRAQLDKDEQGITDLLEKFPKNSAMPVAELGHSDEVTDSESALHNRVYPSAQKVEA
jgi:ATP-dependent protease ClpP protease subunit